MSKWTSKVMAVVWGTIIFAIMLGSYGSATLLESAEAIVGLGIAFGLAIELLNNLFDNGRKFYSGGKKAPLNIITGAIIFAGICGFALPFVGRLSFFNLSAGTGLALALAGFYIVLPVRFTLIPGSMKIWFVDPFAWGFIQLQLILAIVLYILGHGWLLHLI